MVASTSLFADMAANVAGQRAQVVALAPAGADVEDYQPRPEDARRVSEADVLILNGLGLDRWAEELVQNAARQDAARVTLAEGLATIESPEQEQAAEDHDESDAEGEHAHEGANPHLWLDVRYGKAYTEKIRDALVAADPDGAEVYRTNQAAYAKQLDELDAWIRQQVETIPPERRKLVTFHDAFPAFAQAYGFSVVGFIAPDTAHEPSAGELAELVQKVKTAQVPAVFGEGQFSPKLVEALGQEAGVTVVTDLYNDSVGPPPADTYVGVMRHNVTRMVEALG